MLFKDQIEKREELEQKGLQDAIDSLIESAGLHTRSGHKVHSDGYAVRDILDALGIKDYHLEEDDFTTPEEQLERILLPQGIMHRRVQLSGKWWRETTGPLLGRTKEGQLVALLPKRWSDSYSYINREGLRTTINRKQMNEELEDEALCFYPALPSRQLNYRDLIRFVIGALRMPDIALLLFICLVVSLFGMFTPFINKQIFDTIIPSGTRDDILPIAFLLIGAGIGSALFGVTRSLMMARIEDLVSLRVQPSVMARTFLLKPNFFWQYSSGELSDRITSVNQLCNLLNEILLSTSLGVLFSLIYVFQMAEYATGLMMPALAILAAQVFLMLSSFLISTRYQELQLKARTKLSGLVFNLFSGIQKIKLTGSEKRAFTRWAASYRPAATYEYNPPLFLKLMPALSGMVSLGGTIWLYTTAVRQAVTPSDYIAFTAAYGLISGAIMQLAGVVPQVAMVGPLIRMAAPILEAIPEQSEQSVQVNSLSGSIEVSNLTFRYNEESPLVIDNLTLKIRPGEYLGIVGKSGCGKSTLLRLLLGFERPMTGAIYYDDYDLEKVDKSSLRRCIGTCLQSGSLFPGDVFSNLTITAPWRTEADAWEAARLANIDRDIRELPMGMHTLISEGGGGGFSGGQKQRLLIARALLNKPSILFFDEATSALDNISQKQVSDNLDQLGCTRVVIAHRFSTIRHCDRIIVLDKGRIAEEGTFDSLMEQKGLFYEMSKRQL